MKKELEMNCNNLWSLLIDLEEYLMWNMYSVKVVF